MALLVIFPIIGNDLHMLAGCMYRWEMRGPDPNGNEPGQLGLPLFGPVFY